MIDLTQAKHAFQTYVSAYDPSVPEIRLKIVHTFAVISCSEFLCDQLSLSLEDRALASLIALLHDIGRFEQWMRYHSFVDYETVDHAQFSSELLFEEGLIRRFLPSDAYDAIIRSAIEQHNKYQVEPGFDSRTLLFIHLIRDADKLDNYRVKEEETIETLLGVPADAANRSSITPAVYDQIWNHQLVYSPSRKTPLDFWLSYAAYAFDLHFDASLRYLTDQNWINRIFDRLAPECPDVKSQYEALRQRTLAYAAQRAARHTPA